MTRFVWRRIDPTKRLMIGGGGRGLSGGLRGGRNGGLSNRSGGKAQRQ